jgi:DNA primase
MAPAFIASALLIQVPSLYELIKEKTLPLEISAPGMEMFKQILELLQSDPLLETKGIYEQLSAKGWSLAQLEACAKKVSFIPAAGWEAEFLGAIDRLVVIGQEQVAEKLLQKAKTMGLSEEEKLLLKKIFNSRESIS